MIGGITMAVPNRECPAGQEVVLDVDDDEDVLKRRLHRFLPG